MGNLPPLLTRQFCILVDLLSVVFLLPDYAHGEKFIEKAAKGFGHFSNRFSIHKSLHAYIVIQSLGTGSV